MKKILVLITTSFPYGKLEPFIENELEHYSKFDKVIALSLRRIGDARTIDYPTNFSYDYIKEYKFKRDIKFLLLLVFKKNFWFEIYNLIKTSRFTIRNLHHLVSLGLQTEHYYRELKKAIEKFKNPKDEYRFYFYSYWMVEHAMCSIMLKKHYKNAINITRAHGYDLYEYRDKGKYIPYRNYILNNTNYVLPISKDGVRYLTERYGERDNIKLSRLGTKDYSITPYQKSKYNLTLVSCSWCTEVKRIDLIIKALEKIQNLKIKWIHLGDGPLFENLTKIAKELLPSNIEYEFKGAVSNKEIIEYYKQNQIDVFINVSASEGIPVSIMEAQSFGIPVIATDVGGVKEIITHNTNGVLLNKDIKIEELAEEIKKFSLLSENEITRLRNASRKMWEEKYAARKNYEQLFNEIISL